jgi:hypothetical protein
MYNFADTKAATANAYLNPGIYRLKVTEVKQDKFAKGTPYIGFKFENEEGVTFIEKFTFGSEESTKVSMSRLQYLHEGFFGKSCTKSLKNIEEITEYFSKWLTTKEIVKTILVGGNESGNVVYACLPYSGFFIDEDANFELGEFEPGTKEYKKVIRKNKSTSEVSDKPNGLLNDAEDEEIGSKAKPKDESKKKAEKEPAKEECPW